MKKDRLYHIWYDMIRRCEDPRSVGWRIYGGRGICVCPGWHNFKVFKEWAMSHGYTEDLTIERIDNDGDYSPGNCMWATMKEQGNNRRNNVLVSYHGRTQTLQQWADEIGVKYHTLYTRLFVSDWPVELAFHPSLRGAAT